VRKTSADPVAARDFNNASHGVVNGAGAETVLDLAGPVGLFAAACFGHLVVLLRSHNFWYGVDLPSDTSHAATHIPGKPGLGLCGVIRLCHGVAFLAGPALAWWFVGLDLSPLFQPSAEAAWHAVGAYVLVCWIAAFAIFPAVTVHRWLRRPTAALVETRRETFDVAQALGYPPIGRGSHHSLAHVPGNELFRVDLYEHVLRLPRLPAALDGLTILHLSDLHLKGTPDRNFFRAVMDRCAAWKPDLVAITGDIADSVHHQKWIIPVLGRLSWKVAGLAILGNHDYWYDPPFIRRRLDRLGFHYLGNGWRQLTVRGEPFIVIGQEYPWTRPGPDLSGCPDGPFRLLLSHTPDNVRWARRARVDLMLAGHVHGGQLRLPGIGSILVPSIYGRKYDEGFFDESPTLLYVSRGLAGEQPLRLFCRPEVALLTLRCR
jgi:predicted MPP superfamily phosphohydrolase